MARSRPSPLLALPGVLLLTAVGCLRAAAPPTPPAGFETLCCVRGSEAITLQYLGVGGWLFRFGDSALLTAPFFSNPSLLAVGLGSLASDTARVDRYLPPVEDVEAILVGHAHYDHLLDVPYILREKAPRARMYGSRTAVNLVRGDREVEAHRLVEVEGRAGDHFRAGEWVHLHGGRIRFMPLRSGHAPHFLGIHLYRGEVEEPLHQLPDRASEWLEGEPLAYLVDFLGREGEVVFRIHYQDAASEAPAGFPPPLEDGIPVDLTILCPPGADEVEGYPERILEALAPEFVFLGHWEDFFRPRDEPLRPAPGTDLSSFLERMEGALAPEAEWILPNPGTAFRILAEGSRRGGRLRVEERPLAEG